MKTVKVRIAVAVDPSGHWNASGWKTDKGGKQAMDICIDGVADGEARYWVTAELPIPEDREVVGDVTPDDEQNHLVS